MKLVCVGYVTSLKLTGFDFDVGVVVDAYDMIQVQLQCKCGVFRRRLTISVVISIVIVFRYICRWESEIW